jgi:DnaJ-related protein SCJ1
VLEHTARFTLDVPRGAPEGHEVIYEGEGDESPDWEPGDVVLRVRSRAESGAWRRKESSLYWKETIGVDEVCWLPHTNLFFSNLSHPRIHPRPFF